MAEVRWEPDPRELGVYPGGDHREEVPALLSAPTLKAVVQRLRLLHRAVQHLPEQAQAEKLAEARRHGLEWLRR